MYIISVYFKDEYDHAYQFDFAPRSKDEAVEKARAIKATGFEFTDSRGSMWFYGSHRVLGVSVKEAECFVQDTVHQCEPISELRK